MCVSEFEWEEKINIKTDKCKKTIRIKEIKWSFFSGGRRGFGIVLWLNANSIYN